MILDALIRQAPAEVPSVAGMSLVSPGQKGAPQKAKTSDFLAAYSTMPWLRSATKRISDAVASIEWQLFAEGRAAQAVQLARMEPAARWEKTRSLVKQGDLMPVENHQLMQLLDKGNAQMDGRQLRQVTQAMFDLTGESFWILEMNGRGLPVQAFSIPPSWVISTPKPGGKNAFEIRRPGQGVGIDVPAEFVLYFKDPDPADPYGRGVGTARTLADELDTDEFASQHVKNYFLNGARPDLLVFGEDLTQDNTEHLEQRWQEKLGGLLNRHRPFFMNRKIDVKEVGHNFGQMQMTELRKFERDTIVQVFGVPPEIVGIITNSNRATSLSADFHFARWVLVPRAEMMRAVFQRQLVPFYERAFGQKLFVDYVSPISEDEEFEKTFSQAHPYAFMVDELREMTGRDPLPDGDGEKFPLPFNLVFNDSHEGLDDGADSESPTPAPTSPAPQDDVAEEAQTAARGRAKAIIDASVIEQVLKALDIDVLREAFKPVLETTVQHFGSTAAEIVGSDIEFNPRDERVVEFISRHGLDQIPRIHTTTRNRVRAAILEGIAEGEGSEGVAQRIEQVFKASRGARARAIARTEITRASNFGNSEGMKQAGADEHEWLSTRDSSVRDSHVQGNLDGQIRAIGTNFVSPLTGSSGPYPGSMDSADENVNCRCTTIPVLPGVLRTLSPDEKERRRAFVWKTVARRRLPFERAAVRAFRAGFRMQERAALAALREEV